MRYIARWSNGYWKAFDTRNFEDVELFLTQKEAVYATHKLNRRR